MAWHVFYAGDGKMPPYYRRELMYPSLHIYLTGMSKKLVVGLGGIYNVRRYSQIG